MRRRSGEAQRGTVFGALLSTLAICSTALPIAHCARTHVIVCRSASSARYSARRLSSVGGAGDPSCARKPSAHARLQQARARASAMAARARGSGLKALGLRGQVRRDNVGCTGPGAAEPTHGAWRIRMRTRGGTPRRAAIRRTVCVVRSTPSRAGGLPPAAGSALACATSRSACCAAGKPG
jgi:hypothetical protein